MHQYSLVLLVLLGLAAASAQSEQTPTAEQGRQLWIKEVLGAKGDSRACTTCHGTDLTQAGEHQRTHKLIEPMAKSVTPSRYEDPKKVAKWFRRNCKWIWGRECTAEEKRAILSYLKSQ